MAEIHRTGFTLLSPRTDARDGPFRFNVIFVHGLRGHPRATWTEKIDGRAEKIDDDRRRNSRGFIARLRKGQKRSAETHRPASPQLTEVFWPRDYLIDEIPQARVWTYGYNADVIGLFQANNQNSISQHAQNLAVRLIREVENEDPIIFVAHSLGGIIVKEALCRSEDCCKRTKFIVFLGTPHRGSAMAGWGQIASNLARIGLQDSNKRILDALEVNGEVLDMIHRGFKRVAKSYSIRVHSFQEAQGMSGLSGLNGKVVDDFSSKLDLDETLETVESIDANHMQIARCKNRDDECYRAIAGVLRQFVRENGSTATSIDAALHPLPPDRPRDSAPQAQPSSHKTSDSNDSGEDNSSYNLETMGLLHRAVMMGVTDILKEELESGHDPNVKTPDGIAPLHLAAFSDHAEAAQLLLEAGADINARASHGQTALNFAAQENSINVVKVLLQHSPEVDLPNDAGQTPLFAAATKGYLEILEMLLDAGANVHVQQFNQKWTALHLGVIHGQVDIVKAMIRRNPGDKNLLEAASVTGVRPLHGACAKGQKDIVKVLLDAGCDVDAQDENGLTPLRQAVQESELDIAKLLLERGARTEIQSVNRISLVDTARLLQDPGMRDLLIAYGAS